MTGYKVVRKIKNKYFSCWVGGKLKVEYKINKWVSAHRKQQKEGYGLLFFNTLHNAQNFCFTTDSWSIFKVEVKKMDLHAKYKNIRLNQAA